MENGDNAGVRFVRKRTVSDSLTRLMIEVEHSSTKWHGLLINADHTSRGRRPRYGFEGFRAVEFAGEAIDYLLACVIFSAADKSR